MKIFFTTILIILAATSAFADHTAFVSKPTVPSARSMHSARMPGRYPPYSRNQPHFERDHSLVQNEASSRSASRYPAYSRNHPRF